MVALATILIQVVAKATSFPGSAGQSILAREEECASFRPAVGLLQGCQREPAIGQFGRESLVFGSIILSLPR